MNSAATVRIHASQFPENVRRDLLASLRTRRVNHKFHYDSVKQTQKWLALHEAGMPADALAIFTDVSKVSYAQLGKGDPVLDGPDALKVADRATELGKWFRSNYRKAEAMAKAHSSR